MDNRSVSSGSYFHQTRYGQRPHHLLPNSNPNSFLPQSPLHHLPQQFRPLQPPPPPPPPPPAPSYHHPVPVQQQWHQFNYPFNHHNPLPPSRLPPDLIGENHRSRVLQPRSYHHHDPIVTSNSNSSSSNSRHELLLESNSSRFIEEQQQRRDFSFGTSNSDRDFAITNSSSSTNNNISNQFSPSTVVVRDDDDSERVVLENQRWVAHSSEGNRKRDHHHFTASSRSGRDVNVEHGASGSSSREGSFEFNRTNTPRKLKKSALLRIQKPIHNSNVKFRIVRDDDRGGHHYSSGYFDNSSSFRGGGGGNKDKDQNAYHHHHHHNLDRGSTGDQVREGSPVELDVSFKSNSLVAKAIVTPPSTDVSDSNLAPPRNAKLRKVLVPDKDSSTSPPIKPNKAKNVPVVVKSTSSSDKDHKQSKQEVEVSGSGGTKVLIGKCEKERSTKANLSNKGGDNVVSGKPSLAKVCKKKKIVKRPVKKVLNPSLNSSISQPTIKSDEPVVADNSLVPGHPAYSEPEKDASATLVKVVDSRPAKDCDKAAIADSFVHGQPASFVPEKDASGTSVNVVDSQHCSNETTAVMPENGRVEGLAEPMSSENGTSADSGRLCIPSKKRKRSCSTSSLSSSSLEETKINENMENNDLTSYSHAISNANEDCTKLVHETAGSDIGGVEDLGTQLCQSGDSLLENNAASRSPKNLFSPKGNSDCGIVGTRIDEVPSSSLDLISGYESENGLIKLTEGTTVSDNGTIDVICKEACTNEGSTPLENGIVDEFLNSCFSVGSSQIWQCRIGEMTTGNVARSASPSIERPGTIFASGNGHNVLTENSSSSHGDSMGKQPSPERVGISFENVPIGGLLNQTASMGGSEEDDTLNISESDMKVGRSELDLTKSEVNDMYTEPANMVSASCWVDTTLRLSFKDPTPTECRFSGVNGGDTGPQTCTDGEIFLTQRSAMDISEPNVSVSSCISVCPNSSLIQKGEKRSVSGSLELYCPVTTNVIEEPLIAGVSAPSVEMPSISGGGLTEPEVEEATVSALDPLCSSDLSPLQKAASLDCSGGGYDRIVAPLRDAVGDDGLKCDHSHSTAENLADPKVKTVCPTGFQDEQIPDATLVVTGISHLNNYIHAGGEGEKMGVDAADEQPIVDSVAGKHQFSSEFLPLNSDERLPSVDMEDENRYYVKRDSPSVSNNLSSLREPNGVSASDTNVEAVGLGSDTLSDMDCQETLPIVPSMSHSQLSLKKADRVGEILLGKLATQDGSSISDIIGGSLSTEFNLISDHAVENAHSFSGKTETLPSRDVKSSSQILNAVRVSGRKNQHGQAAFGIYPGCSSFVLNASKNTASSNHISKTRTWHRTDSSSASTPPGNKANSGPVSNQSQLAKKVTKFQSTSYIRKGNSLVRKPASVAAQSQGSHGLSSSVCQLNSSGTDEVKKNAGCGTRTGIADPPKFVRSGASSSFERLRTPPLPSSNKMPNHSTNSSRDCVSSPLLETPHQYATETASDPMTSIESNDRLKSSEDAIKISEKSTIQPSQIGDLDCHTEQNDGNMASSNAIANGITYVKRKSNQLVATSNPCSLSMKNSHSTPALPSDSYYKRRKNQLIRTSLENHVKPTSSMPDGSINIEGHAVPNVTSSRSLAKRRSLKVVSKMHKPSKSSLVWTLRGACSAQLSNYSSDLLHRQKVLPQLFPWKRATFWRSFIPNSAVINGSSSTIRKLLLLRRRDTVYTRSKHGFSLRKSKVLSVGGSSLKWSKSIESQSKKANEEATLAVAEAERKKREQIGASHVSSGTKNRSSSSRKSVHSIKLHPGERIFRIGSVRYKMDSSRRTLQRISDDESSNNPAFQMGKEAKRSYVPRRLVIGKDEYVRIGNGNQLVRDPKKRTRILASEKVRWSLHTARSRLARRRKYCQFFTRFGKCNKDDGKCPYIHDSSKIAVCTKFLNGLCFNPDCKLTHKVIPERMPDCSYFLQGLCTNKSCPYRHVHVNPNASTCEGFLRGYCADGNECRKKHSYVCPTYEATGSCPQGSKCKLHHPKVRTKGKKSKQSRVKKNALGRYFGSPHLNISDPGTAVSKKHSMQDNGYFCFDGSIADYISLDVSDEAEQNSHLTCEQTSFGDSDPSDLQLVDLEELIKPIRIMNTC